MLDIVEKKRKRLTMEEKQQILIFCSKNSSKTQRDLAKELNIPLGTLNGLLKNKTNVENMNGNVKAKNIICNYKTKSIDNRLFE